MGYGVITAIALSLAMDALAAAMAAGAAARVVRPGQALKTGLFFGAFQMLMPVLGWAGGLTVGRFIAGVDHWIAFLLLVFVGGKMIYESSRSGGKELPAAPFATPALFLLAVATSIDAFAVGLSFSFLGFGIAVPAAIIGLVTFLLSFAGVYAGAKFGHVFENKVEIAGGLVLMAIGLKILAEHTGVL